MNEMVQINGSNVSFLICRDGWPLAVGLEEEDALEQAFDYYDSVTMEDIVKVVVIFAGDYAYRRQTENSRTDVVAPIRGFLSFYRPILYKSSIELNLTPPRV